MEIPVFAETNIITSQPLTVPLLAMEIQRKPVATPGLIASILSVKRADTALAADRRVVRIARAKDATFQRVNVSCLITMQAIMLDVIRNVPVAMATMKPVVCLTISPSLIIL